MRNSGPRRVLLTGDTAGGVWTFTLELASGLLQQGFEVCLATFGPRVSDEQRHSANSIKGLRWFHHTSKLEWMADPWDDIENAGKWLLRLAQHEAAELVHLNTLCHADLGWSIPVITTVHSCVPSWWQAVHESPLPSNWHCYRRRVELSLRASTVLVAPSKASLTTISQHYDVEIESAIVIPNGRTSGIFHRAPKKPIIFSVGRLWDDAKNVGALANLAPRLKWPVYLAGEADRPLPHCHMLGQLGTSQLSSWYAEAAIYVSPAKYEPFGLSILEAAMSGCALVLNNIPSLLENWSGAAAFCEPHELEPVLNRIIDDSVARTVLSDHAFVRSSRFTQASMVKNYVAAYEFAWAKGQVGVARHACAS